MAEIRWNYERSKERHFDDGKALFHFVIYGPSYHESVKGKIMDKFSGFDFFQGFEDFEEFYGNKERTMMKYKYFGFKTTRSPEKINWKDITSMPVKKDSKISEKNKKGIENYLSDLYNK